MVFLALTCIENGGFQPVLIKSTPIGATRKVILTRFFYKAAHLPVAK